MEAFTAWLKERRSELYLVAKHWPPIIKTSLISSLVWWAGALGLASIATLIALLITYSRQLRVELSDYFPPNFWWGVFIGLVVIFIYKIVIETAITIDKYRIGADKFTWNDVSRKIAKPSDHGPNIIGLRIANQKPFDIHNSIVKIVAIQTNRFSVPSGTVIPINLCWITDRGQTWGGKKLGKNETENRFLAIAGWFHPKENPILMTGYSDGNSTGKMQPIEIEADSEYILTLEWSGEIDGHLMDAYKSRYLLKFDKKEFHLRETNSK